MSSPRPFGPALMRRMAPLALVTLVLVGVALPAVYHRLAVAERAAEAQTWAQHLAGKIEVLARARPLLWGFDRPALNELAQPLLGQPVDAHVRVDTALTDRAFTAGSPPPKGAVLGWALIVIDGRKIGRVGVSLDARGVRADARQLWWLASIAGVLLGLLLFVLPALAVRRADARTGELWEALSDANAHLEARVASRTQELAQREVQLQELSARLVAAQEEERARISRDLHDDLGQTLTGLRLRLTALDDQVSEAGKPNLEAALAAIDNGVEEVRRLAHNLRPPALDALGASGALATHAESWAETAGLELTLTLPDIDPPADIGEVVFRVGQEALTNIARHAKASRVWLVVEPADDGWRLCVEDDGVGLPDLIGPDQANKGLGLVGARERVEVLGGYLDIDSSEHGGVCLTAWLPEKDSV